MKFKLKDYQSEAVALLLERLERAQSDYRESEKRSSVSLCATTGAGKTVMSAAVIEALFYGDDEFDADDGAVVVWFSDNPDLNEQTRNRLMEASDKLTLSDLVTIEYPFSRRDLEPGKVYFLNTQKLTRSSRLARGQVDEGDENRFEEFRQPDDQAANIWEILRNTINDEERTLYLFLDEAHRGFGTRSTRDKATIVKTLVNGSDQTPSIPIVVGISATIGKFTTAMTDAEFAASRQVLEPVSVDGARVQESGLLKDTVVLDFTTEAGVFDRALVRRGAEKLDASTRAWREYAHSQKDPAASVMPLLVLQIPNKPDHDQVGDALNVIGEVIPSVTQEAVRHVLGEHSVQEFGSWTVNWIEPQSVEDRTDVRVLIAKEAISTGWDCPRAEVMVSFRTAKEHDHITQVLGRMVRNPLARRVPGDERLNSVDCLLPHFDRTTAGKVVKFLTGLIPDIPGGGKKVLIDGRETRPNPQLPDEVWDAWRRTPTQLLPQRGVRPVSRLLQFATNLARDRIKPGAEAEAKRRMITELEAQAHRFPDDLAKAQTEVLTIHGMSIAGTTGETKLRYEEFVMAADDQAVLNAFREATKAFGDVAQAYVDKHATDGDDFDDPVRSAMVEIAALATVPKIRVEVEKTANELFDEWDHLHRARVEQLSDLRRTDYRDVKAQAPDPQTTELIRPRIRMEDFKRLSGDLPVPADLANKHLMSDKDGNYPISSLNDWELPVMLTELGRHTTIAWYRNPPRSAGDSICIAYRNEFGNWRGLYPDFIVYERISDAIMPSIVDPHRWDLPDAILKLRALSTFAEEHGGKFHRIESVVVHHDEIRRLNLKSPREQRRVKYWSDRPVLDLYLPSPAGS